MARVVTLSDRLMRRFGLHGRSIIPLISGLACAIPAVMATRGIGRRKERLLTILVVPLMSCSARLPVYTMLIALIFTSTTTWVGLNPQGLLLLGMYLLGGVAALAMSALLSRLLPRSGSSFLVIELPPYRWPILRNLFITIYEKVRSFVLEAGKVILSISVILWILASYGGSSTYERELIYLRTKGDPISSQEKSSLRLKHSYMGQLGRSIEPFIAPLGYDWKIGIALVSSFAAREVFVSTLAIVYSLGNTEETTGLQQRLREERNKSTGKPVFGLAVCVSLLLFYAFAMQCMSTVAVVYRETGTWYWPPTANTLYERTCVCLSLACLHFLVMKKRYDIGILGGGQLGRMIVEEGRAWDLRFKILDPKKDAPAAQVSHDFLCGRLDDIAALRAMAEDCEVLTIEIEQAKVDALAVLESEGHLILPSSSHLACLQDKGLQKQYFKKIGLPTADFAILSEASEAAKHEDLFPAVL